MATKMKIGAEPSCAAINKTTAKYAPRRIVYAITLAIGSMLPAMVQAEPAAMNATVKQTFSIPAGQLDAALQSLASSANVMLVFTPEQVKGASTAGLQGTYSVQQAFEKLLAGSGLRVENSGGSYHLLPASTAPAAKNDKNAKGNDELVVPELSVVGGLSDSVYAGRSTLKKEDVDRVQADNVAALLDKLPGVNMAGSPRPGGQSLNIWGMGRTEDVKIVLDGAPKGFEKYRQGSVFIEPELIKQIDVDKGPHNLMDGNGGFGGTINIQTKDAGDLLKPGENLGGMLKYGYHTNDKQGIYSGALYGRTEDGSADGLLYVNKRDGGNIKRPDGTRFLYSKNDQATYLLKTNLYFNDSQTLTLAAMRSDSSGWQPFAAKRDDMNAPSQADIKKYGLDEAWRRLLVYRDQTDENYSIKWNIAPADKPWLDLTVSYANSKTKQHDERSPLASTASYLGSLGNESWVTYTDNQIDINNKSRFSTGPLDHKVTVGVRWHENKRDTLMYYPIQKKSPSYNYGYFQPYYMPAGKAETRSLYLEDAITYDTLTVTPGVRYDRVTNTGQPNLAPRFNDPDPLAGHDYSSVTYQGFSPHLGAIWQATPHLSLFADVSRTWRAPVIDEQYEVQSIASNVPGTSRDLKKETIDGVRLGAIWDYNNLMQDQDSLQVRTTLFRNRGKNEIFYRRGVLCESKTCNAPLSNYRNLPGYTIQGMEIESFYDSQNVFGSLSYSTMRGQRDTSPRDPWSGKTWIAEIPPTTAHAMLGVKVPRWEMKLGWTGDFVRKQDRSPTDGDPMAVFWALPTTKGYVLQGLFASWQPSKLPGFEARVTVDNLFNTNYYPYLGESVSGVGRDFKFSIMQRF